MTGLINVLILNNSMEDENKEIKTTCFLIGADDGSQNLFTIIANATFLGSVLSNRRIKGRWDR